MLQLTLGTLALAAVLILSEAIAVAQMGMPSMPSAGGGAPRRQKRNNGPVLSPALNMVPGVATSFEGQFLMRTVPQEQVNRSTAQFNQQLSGLQGQLSKQETQIKSGLGKSGHSAMYLNTGKYFGGGGGGRRR
jgi:hypothetical protein